VRYIPFLSHYVAIQQFYGGQSSDEAIGTPASFSYSRALDHRRNPSQLTVLPGPRQLSTGVVQDLILNMAQIQNGTRYAYGDQGNIYKISTGNVVTYFGKLSTGSDGQLYRSDNDAMYFATQTDIRRAYPMSGTPALDVTYGPSKSSDTLATRTGGTLTYTIPLVIDESQYISFKPDIEPFYSQKVNVVAKGTGNVTMTLHDGLNNTLATTTITAANMATGLVEFLYSSQIRALVKPNARTYHLHFTSTVADTTLACSTANSLNTADFELWAYLLVDTVNNFHPMAQFQQFNCFAAGTRVPTKEGVSNIEDLVGKTVDVIAGDGEYRPAEFKEYGQQEIYEVKFSTGEKVYCTADHQWVVRYSDKKIPTTGLVNRSVPRITAPRPEKNDDYYEGIRHGIVYGDGTLTNTTGSDTWKESWVRSAVVLIGKKKELLRYFEDYSVITQHVDRYTEPDALRISGLPANFKELPEESKSPSYWYGFVSGLIATDGCVDKRDGCVSIAQTGLELHDALLRYLPMTGMVTGQPTKLSSKGTINYISGRAFVTTDDGYVLNLKKQFITPDDLIRSDQRKTFIANNKQTNYGKYANVESVTPTGRIETVYCCREPETSSFVIDNSILTGNCIGNGNYLAVWEPLTDSNPPNTEFQRHRLTFPAGFEVCGIAVTNEFAVIACAKYSSDGTKDFQEGKLFLWDGTSQTYNQIIDVAGGAPEGIKTKDNMPYFIVNGKLCVWAGGNNITQVRRISSLDNTFASVIDNTRVYPNMLAVKDNMLHLGFPSKTSNTAVEHGVYVWGSMEKNYPESFNYGYVPSNMQTGTTNLNTSGNLQLGCVKSFGDEMYLSWKDKDSNYGLDIVDNLCIPAPVFKFRSRRFDAGQAHRNKLILKQAVTTAPLGAGVAITAVSSIDGAAYVNGQSMVTASDRLVSPINQPNAFKRVVTGFDGTCATSVTTSPTIYSQIIEYKPQETQFSL
jgi:hypothetical protein